MDINKRLELIKRNCKEIVTEDELKELLKNKKQPSVYIGTAITGRPHVAYFLWVLKLADFLKAGFKVKVLLSDITGALDNTAQLRPVTFEWTDELDKKSKEKIVDAIKESV